MTGMSSEADGPDSSGLVANEPGSAAVEVGTGQTVAAAAHTVTELFRQHERLHRRWRGSNGEASSLDQECNVLSLGPVVTDPLVECFSIGVLKHGKLEILPGFPSATSSGISSQDAIAW